MAIRDANPDLASDVRELRLTPGRLAPWLGGAAGRLLLRPWFDALALPGIVRWYFPLSRAWAAASLAGTDVERFLLEVPSATLPRRLTARALAAVASRRRSYDEAAAAWENAFFASSSPARGALVAAESMRETAAHAWMAARGAFVPLHLHTAFPPLKWLPSSEAEVERRHGPRLADAAFAFPPPPVPAVTLSHAVPSADGRTRWLRFPATVAGTPDTAWARVVEPASGRDPPTLIFLHGVGVESEFWNADLGRVDTLARAGIRIVRPEAPWHGRRRPEGWYGGEKVMALGPLGLLDLFAAWVAEVAALIAWARSTSRGPVAVGGISLGALTSQLVATAAAHWPAALRPDALLLVGTTCDVLDAAVSGGLGRALGVGDRLTEEAWTSQAMQRWRPLLEPEGAPAPAPEAVVMVIGRSDEVTRFDGGRALARRWQLPEENLFLRPQGHFSVALGLEHDAAPLDRLAAILQRRRG